jgi:predicted GTPase
MKLGFGTPILISAEHNLGFSNLHDVLHEKMKVQEKEPEPEEKVEKLRKVERVRKVEKIKSNLIN